MLLPRNRVNVRDSHKSLGLNKIGYFTKNDGTMRKTIDRIKYNQGRTLTAITNKVHMPYKNSPVYGTVNHL